MCIRDSTQAALEKQIKENDKSSAARVAAAAAAAKKVEQKITCLLYTSDAADERSSVDLGGRRIIKKKHQHDTNASAYSIHKVSTQHTTSNT